MCVTKAEYDEHGKNICREKFDSWDCLHNSGCTLSQWWLENVTVFTKVKSKHTIVWLYPRHCVTSYWYSTIPMVLNQALKTWVVYQMCESTLTTQTVRYRPHSCRSRHYLQLSEPTKLLCCKKTKHRLVTRKTVLKGAVVRPKEAKLYPLLFVPNKLDYNKDVCTFPSYAICVFTYSLFAGSSWRYFVVDLETAWCEFATILGGLIWGFNWCSIKASLGFPVFTPVLASGKKFKLDFPAGRGLSRRGNLC